MATDRLLDDVGRGVVHVAGPLDSVHAVFAANDAMALGVLGFARDGSRRTGDVGVVDFDDMPETEFYRPPLTTVRQDFAALGRRAPGLNARALGGEVQAVAELVAPVLVVRESSARP